MPYVAATRWSTTCHKLLQVTCAIDNRCRSKICQLSLACLMWKQTFSRLISRLRLYNVQSGPKELLKPRYINLHITLHYITLQKKWGHKLMAIILSNLNRFTPSTFFTRRFLGKFAVKYTVSSILANAATLPQIHDESTTQILHLPRHLESHGPSNGSPKLRHNSLPVTAFRHRWLAYRLETASLHPTNNVNNNDKRWA